MRLGYRMSVDLRSRTEVFAYYTGRYDTDLIAAALRVLPRAGGVAVDVGANVGFWSVPFAQRGTAHAYEPVPGNVASLHRNAELNDVQDRLHIHPVGLSDQAGTATITLRGDFQRGAATGNASIVIEDSDHSDRRFDTIDITLDTLDNHALTQIDVMKVDIEGQEDRFLHGARNSLAQFRPVIWIEWNPVYYERRKVDPAEAVAAALSGLEYAYLRRVAGRWQEVDRFASPLGMDDLVMCPRDRLADVLPML